MNRAHVSAAGVALGTIAATVTLLALLLTLAGYDAQVALLALWRGSFGTRYAFFSATLVYATPLLIAGLATIAAFRANVMNIGVEGQLLVGAACSAAVALTCPTLGIALLPIGILAGALGGLAWSAIPAILRSKFGVVEVITTLMLNAVAMHVVGWLVRGPLQEPTHVYPQTAVIVASARLPIIAGSTRLHAGFVFAAALTVFAWWFFAHTTAGFKLRAVGAGPRAARAAGRVRVDTVATAALLVSGAIAGVAGAVQVQGVTFALYESLSAGYGYTAIAVALLARLDARVLLPSALLFAALEAGAGAMQRDAGVPAVLVKIVEATLLLAFVAWDAIRRRRFAANSA